MKLISRKEALAKELPRYFTGKPCSKGHIAEQLVYDKRSYKCLTMRNTLWLKKQNAEKRKKLHRERYHKDIANLKKHYGLLDTSDESIKKARAKRNGGKKFKNASITVKEYRKNNIEKVRAWKRQYEMKQKNIPEIKLIANMRSRLWQILKRKKQAKTIELLGCSGIFLKQHIQKRFKKGMSWKNYGKWHIDHIIPIHYFMKNHNFNSLRIQKKCFNYKNLRPEWAEYNLCKSIKLI